MSLPTMSKYESFVPAGQAAVTEPLNSVSFAPCVGVTLTDPRTAADAVPVDNVLRTNVLASSTVVPARPRTGRRIRAWWAGRLNICCVLRRDRGGITPMGAGAGAP